MSDVRETTKEETHDLQNLLEDCGVLDLVVVGKEHRLGDNLGGSGIVVGDR